MKTGSLRRDDLLPERRESGVVDIAFVAVPRKILRVVEALEAEPMSAVDLGEH